MPNRAPGAANRKSHATETWQPPPMQLPRITAMLGLRRLVSADTASSTALS